MISYEQAKALKDAGFPIPEQKDAGGTLLRHFTGMGDLLYAPTLSELIEACGEEFCELTHYWNHDKKVNGKSPREWQAFAYKYDEYSRHITGNTWGTTPEEAMLNLWLSLNKK